MLDYAIVTAIEQAQTFIILVLPQNNGMNFQPATMMFCINCGQSISADLERCPHCDLKVPVTEQTRIIEDSAPTLLSGAEKPSTPPVQTDDMVMTPGRVLGNRYEIRECIGSGGMGSIFLARRIHIGDKVAVKVLRPEIVHDAQSRERFQREARSAARLHHPNAVVVHDFGQEPDGTTYIVMELLEGQNLRELLTKERYFDPERTMTILKQACAAIEAAHRLGIIHRDIKPDNMILLETHDGTAHVKLLDFGIAKVFESNAENGIADPTLTQVGTVIGTPNYMSPEQCQGESLDARSDIYSMGVVLYEMLTGVQPFTAKNSTAMVIKHVTEQPRRLITVKPDISPEIERVVLKALEKKPEARQQSALDLAREFEQAVTKQNASQSVFAPSQNQVPTQVETQVAKPHKAPAGSFRMPMLIGAAAFLIMLAAGISWWLLSKSASNNTVTTQPVTSVAAQLPPQEPAEPSPTAAVNIPTPPDGMVYIEGGEFKMGRDDSIDIDHPSHLVTVRPFFLDATEVTNAAYQQFITATGHPVPQSWKDNLFPAGTDNMPVTDITWNDANVFAKWAGKRLPTEAEWEYAARGKDGRFYPWGDLYKPGVANINNDIGGGSRNIRTTPVGSFLEGKSPFGIMDMAGNVWEWTASELIAYPGGNLPAEMQNYQNLKVIRGGSWKSDPKQASSTYRRSWPATRGDWPKGIPADQIDYTAIGFRCAQDVPQL